MFTISKQDQIQLKELIANLEKKEHSAKDMYNLICLVRNNLLPQLINMENREDRKDAYSTLDLCLTIAEVIMKNCEHDINKNVEFKNYNEYYIKNILAAFKMDKDI